MAVATNCLTLRHFPSQFNFAERFPFSPKVDHLSEARVVIEFHLVVAVEQVTVGAGMGFFPPLHQEGCLSL